MPPARHKESDEAIRQKLIRQGAAGLTDAELLSIVLRDGGKDQSAIELSEALLDRYNGNLTGLGLERIAALRMFRGMGIARAAVVAAALELGKRRKAEEAVGIDVITGRDDVVAIFKPLIAELPHEEFWALFLGAANRILDKVRISQGGTAATIVDNRLIVRRALDQFAASIVIVHNHPSGQPEPSVQDRQVTEKLRAALNFFDIHLTDHIVVTSGECFSFREKGLL
jgi:DNA repair protein RadC